MTVATVAQPTGNTFAVLLVTFIIVSFITVIGFFLHGRMWDSHERKLGTHAEQLAGLKYRLESLLEFLGVEVPEPVEDDSPAAEANLNDDADVQVSAAEPEPEDPPTLPNIPAIPATEPSGIPVQVHSALIEAPTHELMTPETAEKQRVARAAFVEEQLARFDFTGRRK